MHEIACFATYNFKIFPGSMRPDPLWLACPLLGESGLTLIYAARYALFDAYENFCDKLLTTLIIYREDTDQ